MLRQPGGGTPARLRTPNQAWRRTLTALFPRCIRSRRKSNNASSSARSVPKRRSEVGGFSARGPFELEHQMAQVADAMTGRQEFPDLFVEREQSDGIALLVEEKSEGGGERVRVLRLGVADRAVGHRTAVID